MAYVPYDNKGKYIPPGCPNESGQIHSIGSPYRSHVWDDPPQDYKPTNTQNPKPTGIPKESLFSFLRRLLGIGIKKNNPPL
jgi:hypothetical protein